MGVGSESRERMVAALVDRATTYFKDVEERNEWNQVGAVAAYDYPPSARSEIQDYKECGCCVGAHLAYMFAKDGDLGIEVTPFQVKNQHDGALHVTDLMKGLAHKFGLGNSVIEKFTEHVHNNYSLEDLDPTSEVRNMYDDPPEEYDGRKEDWFGSDMRQNALCDAYDGLVDREVESMYYDCADEEMWGKYLFEKGNKDIKDSFGDIYFFNQGFTALEQYVQRCFSMKIPDMRTVKDTLMDALGDSSGSVFPWAADKWIVNPSEAIGPGIREAIRALEARGYD